MNIIHFIKCVIIIIFSGLNLSCEKEKDEKDNYVSDILINNPYKDIEWQSASFNKASLHTHTSVSDGILAPHQLVDRYRDLGYKILAISDHNNVTYSWENFKEQEPSMWAYQFLEDGIITEDDLIYENRYPDNLEMLAIKANELSNHHHLGCYFINYNNLSSDITSSLIDITDLNGLGVLFHPIKYDYTIEWYHNLYNTYKSLIGIEVYNKKYEYNNEIYFDDFNKWDSLLTLNMPERNIYGFANDDFHTTEMGYTYNVFILSDFSVNEFRKSMEKGSFYFVILSDGHNGSLHPQINSVNIGSKSDYIEIIAENYDYIEWISEGDVVHTGNKINLNKLESVNKYVRAMIYQNNNRNIAGTQAFGIIRKSD